jgi:N-acetylneuraminic acid mutarotase
LWILEKVFRCLKERRLPSVLVQGGRTIKRDAGRLITSVPFVKRYLAFKECRTVLQQQAGGAGVLDWEILPPCPQALYDAGAVQIREELYVVCGYTNLNQVHHCIRVFNLRDGHWTRVIKTPSDMAQSHLALATEDDRYLYVVSGQLGTQCAPAVRTAFVYDIQKDSWQSLPPLPAARYAATMQLLEGRIYIVGGSREDRFTPATDHWSLAVKDGRVWEQQWRVEPPIPRGGTHRAGAVVDGKFYVFGSQYGDFTAIPGDPCYTCTHRTKEEYFPDTYAFDPRAQKWQRKADMPVAASHTDYSWCVVNGKVYLLGGQIFKDPREYFLHVTDVIQEYDPVLDRWRIVGKLPYRVKTVMAAYCGGHLYAMLGQRDQGPDDPRPGRIVNHVWRAPFPV